MLLYYYFSTGKGLDFHGDLNQGLKIHLICTCGEKNGKYLSDSRIPEKQFSCQIHYCLLLLVVMAGDVTADSSLSHPVILALPW